MSAWDFKIIEKTINLSKELKIVTLNKVLTAKNTKIITKDIIQA